jgi:hypothetical protein
MVQTQQNTRSTKLQKQKKAPTEERDDATREDFAPNDNLPQRTPKVYATITDINGKVYTDLTGRFPMTSSKGNKYILVLYEYDGNAILAEPMKTKSDVEAVKAYTVLYIQLTDAGLKPNFQIMDKEASAAVKSFLKKKNRVPTSVTAYPQTERSRTSNLQIQIPFRRRTSNNRWPLPNALVVPIGTPSNDHAKPPAKLKAQQKIVSLRPSLRPLQLRRNPTGTTRNTNCRPQTTKTTGNMGRSWSLRMVYRTGVGTLPMLQGIYNRNGR